MKRGFVQMGKHEESQWRDWQEEKQAMVRLLSREEGPDTRRSWGQSPWLLDRSEDGTILDVLTISFSL